MHKLVVTTPFADYAKGYHITDPEAVAKVLQHHAGHVVRVATDDPEPKPDKPKKSA